MAIHTIVERQLSGFKQFKKIRRYPLGSYVVEEGLVYNGQFRIDLISQSAYRQLVIIQKFGSAVQGPVVRMEMYGEGWRRRLMLSQQLVDGPGNVVSRHASDHKSQACLGPERTAINSGKEQLGVLE